MVPALHALDTTGSDSSFRWAEEMIAYCREWHSCDRAIHSIRASESSRNYRPTRLLDLQAFDIDDQDVRLILGEDVDGNAAYVTLTYCWGMYNAEAYQTKSTNLHQQRDRIQRAALPSTLQDALQIARRLSFRYLWIDALCIMQDSHSDWTIESANMHLVFGNAALNISADTSSDPRGSCFNTESQTFTRHFPHHITVKFKIQPNRESCLNLFACSDNSENALHGGKYFEELEWKFPSIFDAHTTKRGWICQERVLSPRILHYTTE